MQQIFSELLELVKFDRNTIIGLDTVTKPVLAGGKSNPFQDRVHKVMVGAQVILFRRAAYETMVRNRLAAEGKNPDDFELSPLSWGARLPDAPIVEHTNGRQYLQCIFLPSGSGSVEYFVDKQQVADPRTIPGLKRDREEAEQGGLENKVIVRTFKVESIRQIRINNRTVFNLAYF